ncbi:MAG: hypothetical protein HY909_15660 [Deltaproteobacteria bacterium]|nr:hypothetical protein [Deltaproteobacteria bacterium]
MAAPKKLMVTLKLELADGMVVRWLDDSRPGKPWKARVRSVTLPDGTRVAVDSTHVTEATVPVKGSTDRFTVFFMGYFELEPGDPGYAQVQGQRGVAVDTTLDFVDPATGSLAAVGTVYEVTSPGAKAQLSAMG